MLIAIWIAAAFIAGALTRRLGVPSLVGFLAAGFLLRAFGYEADETLHLLAELGVVLLLFTVGLKVRIQSVLRPDVWATALAHMAIVGFFVALGLAGFLDLGMATVLVLTASFAFSSTVVAAKMLEERGQADDLRREGETRTRRQQEITKEISGWKHRQTAVGGRLEGGDEIHLLVILRPAQAED